MSDGGAVAFQGEAGAYSEAALLAYFGPDRATMPCESFDAAFDAVTEGRAAAAILPVENTLGGSIHRNYDLMLRHDLHIIGEWNHPIHHHLLALPGVTLDDIRIVWSHPQALAQCEQTLNRLGVRREPTYDTAGSAKLLAEGGHREVAAIASRRAAAVYGLQIIGSRIEDEPDNLTRFLILARDPRVPPADVAVKTSLVFALDNRPGALYRALSAFALRDLDLTKLESRPLRGRRWQYIFYLDVVGHLSDRTLTRALDHLDEITSFQRVLGNYPVHVAPEPAAEEQAP